MSIESFIIAENITIADSAISPDFVYTDKNKGAGYHRKANSVHTAVYTLQNFTGTVKLQGTLAEYPGEEDWVDINGSEAVITDSSASYNYTFNFTGNFVWIRAAHKVIEGNIALIRINH